LLISVHLYTGYFNIRNYTAYVDTDVPSGDDDLLVETFWRCINSLIQ